MNVQLIDHDDTCRLIFAGELTYENAREIEDRIIDALRRYTRFQVDLSGVREIDLCGIHLLRVLETVAGDMMEIVNDSVIVARTRERLLATTRATWLRGSRNGQDRQGKHAAAA